MNNCNCKGTASPARPLLDGREIATATLNLEADGSDGWFMPDSASLIRWALSQTMYPMLLADLGTHQHHLRNVERAMGPDGPSWSPDPFGGGLVVNQRFYFEVVADPAAVPVA